MNLDERVSRLEAELVQLTTAFLEKTERELKIALEERETLLEKHELIRLRYVQIDDLRIRIERLEERLDGFLPGDLNR
jgi:hypothetical protein